MYKGAILGMLSITAVFAGFTFAMNPDVEETLDNDVASVYGHTTFTITDKDDNVIAVRQSDNMIVLTGMRVLGQNTFGTGTGSVAGLGFVTGPVTHMEIGTGIGGPFVTDTGVTSIPGCARVLSGYTGFTEVSPGGFSQVNVTGTSVFLGTNCAGNVINEAGIFTGLVGGELFARNLVVPAVPALGATDTLTIQWNFTFTDT